MSARQGRTIVPFALHPKALIVHHQILCPRGLSAVLQAANHNRLRNRNLWRHQSEPTRIRQTHHVIATASSTTDRDKWHIRPSTCHTCRGNSRNSRRSQSTSATPTSRIVSGFSNFRRPPPSRSTSALYRIAEKKATNQRGTGRNDGKLDNSSCHFFATF